jgi:hypothetical protein
MASIINDPSVVINNIPIPVKANSVSFKEGLGEQTLRIQSTGGGNVTQVFADNIEMKKSSVKFTLLPDSINPDRAREWKLLANNNTISISGVDNITQKSLKRTFTSCALIPNYEVNLSTDGDIELEFEGATAI